MPAKRSLASTPASCRAASRLRGSTMGCGLRSRAECPGWPTSSIGGKTVRYSQRKPVISPIRDSSGAITSFIAIKRDVTQERALAERSTQAARERALHRGDDPGHSAGRHAGGHCAGDLPPGRHLRRRQGRTSLPLRDDGRAMPIGLAIAGLPDPPLRKLGRRRSRQLRARAVAGPWIEPWVNEPRAPYNQILSRLGLQSAAYAPVRSGGRPHRAAIHGGRGIRRRGRRRRNAAGPRRVRDLAGPLSVRLWSSAPKWQVAATTSRPSSAGERSIRSSSLLSISTSTCPSATRRSRASRTASNAESRVLRRQPRSGSGPSWRSRRFRRPSGAAEALPQSAWLNLNASPDLILAREPLRSLLRGVRRHLVLR